MMQHTKQQKRSMIIAIIFIVIALAGNVLIKIDIHNPALLLIGGGILFLDGLCGIGLMLYVHRQIDKEN